MHGFLQCYGKDRKNGLVCKNAGIVDHGSRDRRTLCLSSGHLHRQSVFRFLHIHFPHKPTGGKVYYKDSEVTGLSEKKMALLRAKEFGFVFQQTHLVSNLTLFENVAPIIIVKSRS